MFLLLERLRPVARISLSSRPSNENFLLSNHARKISIHELRRSSTLLVEAHDEKIQICGLWFGNCLAVARFVSVNQCSSDEERFRKIVCASAARVGRRN